MLVRDGLFISIGYKTSYNPLFINRIDCLVIVYMLQIRNVGIMEVVVVVNIGLT